ncbi:MAG: hypothetical protein SGPRY_007247 [Prymnesium sp.]
MVIRDARARRPGCGQLAEIGGRSPLHAVPSLNAVASPMDLPGTSVCRDEGGSASTGAGERVELDTQTGGEEASSALTQADDMHKGALGFFFPRTFGDCVVRNGAHTSPKPACRKRQPDHFMPVSGAAASSGVSPDQGGALEAKMMFEHVAVMLADLRAQNALPPRVGPKCPLLTSWQEAVRNALALLISACTTFYRARKPGAQQEGESQSAVERGVEKAKEKPPPDSFEAASRAGERQLAVQADILLRVTTFAALRRINVRPSSCEDLTNSSHEERERELDGELSYLVG